MVATGRAASGRHAGRGYRSECVHVFIDSLSSTFIPLSRTQGLSITVRDNPSSSRLGLATEAVYIKDDPQPISISSMQTGFTTYFGAPTPRWSTCARGVVMWWALV